MSKLLLSRSRHGNLKKEYGYERIYVDLFSRMGRETLGIIERTENDKDDTLFIKIIVESQRDNTRDILETLTKRFILLWNTLGRLRDGYVMILDLIAISQEEAS